MTYGLISDIHGNLEALTATLAELAGVDAFLCLGDIVGYGPDPGACVDLIREQPRLTCIAGNHDLAALGHYDLNSFNPYARKAIEWTKSQLSADQTAYLAPLQETAQVDDAIIVHGSLPGHMDYITNTDRAMDCFDAMSESLCLVGHTHVAEYYSNRPGSRVCEQVSLLRGGEILLEPGLRYIVNPGAVGQPRDGNPAASCGIYDTEARTLKVRRVSYEVSVVQEKMRRVGLPDSLIDRLTFGR